jgi:hypothetical protein
MAHEPTIATRAWRIAQKHVVNFDTLYGPARAAILAAITEALREPPPPAPELDEIIASI